MERRWIVRNNENTPRSFVSSDEQERVSRGLLSWLNQYPDFPAGVRRINFEYLEEDKPCMALSTIQGSYITKQYVGGDYMAEYQFKLVYRGQPGDSNNNRLKMDEVLDTVGDWAARRRDRPDIGGGKQVRRITVNARSSLFGRYENGDEDHQILMTMSYYAERSV